MKNNECELLKAIEDAVLHLAAIGFPRNEFGDYDKDGEWEFIEAVPQKKDAREVKLAFGVLRSAIAKIKEDIGNG